MSSLRKPPHEQDDIPFQPIVSNMSKTYLISKRCTDLVLTIIGLLLLTPVFIIVATCIKIEDVESPIFFRQVRVGRNGKVFTMYKFRSMVSNAEELKGQLIIQNEVQGPIFKIKDDPRVTKVGKIIRKTSIDELPQLYNVLKGEMSLVGPRPPLPQEVATYSSYDYQRLSITPGLTCYWQVRGRSSLGFKDMVELDLKYLRERNYYVDLKLIIKTVFVLFGSKNAF
ncbi:sugar transferase [Ureibacillus manganicus]|uniref:Multidrug MFS transporter n=1 Tax=Ureibacillus manganicus DSM 26584 TaxID=1384049 RepID=A0A0A3I4P7_9BACL|nr:sugar transferase [Ureibacillus manganicus]KGR77648.1 multidrug MFS transporter [Ureibacillus manganicus DSM 26584]